MGNWLQAIGTGLLGGGVGFLLGGPIGAAAGFGIGLFGAASGMSGNQQMGTWGGVAMGGLAGAAFGPVGMMVGGLLGGLFGNAVGKQFAQQPQQPPYAPYFGGGGYGMPPYGGGMPGGFGFPQGGFGGMQGGFGMPGYGMPGGCGFMMFGGCFPPPQYGNPAFPPINQQQPQQQGGVISGGQGQPITYTTQGGFKVTSNGSTVTITTPDGKHEVRHWGDPHENLDGKQLKDWQGKDRTIVLQDGTRVTMNATGPQGTIQNTTIFDGGQEVRIDNNKNTFSAQFNPWQTYNDARALPMGETALFGQNRDGSVIYRNVFQDLTRAA